MIYSKKFTRKVLQSKSYMIVYELFIYVSGWLSSSYEMYFSNKTDDLSVTKRTCKMQPFSYKWQLLD